MPKRGAKTNAATEMLRMEEAEDTVCPVVTVTTKLEVVPEVTVKVSGETEQVAYCGAPEQESLAVPEKPVPAATARLYVAAVPLVTLVEVEPPSETPRVRSATPVPVSVTVCGDAGALSAMVRVPVRTPPTVGVKVMFTVHEAPAGMLDPQVFVSEKSPEAATPETVTDVFPVFVT